MTALDKMTPIILYLIIMLIPFIFITSLIYSSFLEIEADTTEMIDFIFCIQNSVNHNYSYAVIIALILNSFDIVHVGAI